jgi:hypothetical protein
MRNEKNKEKRKLCLPFDGGNLGVTHICGGGMEVAGVDVLMCSSGGAEG